MWKVDKPLPGQNPAAFKDFLRRLSIAEQIKVAMRRKYALAVYQAAGESAERFLSRSREFWESYEWVNRLWVPEDPVYSGTRAGVTLATSTDLWTLTTASTAQARVLESFIGGEATSSTVLRFAVQISTSGTTPTNATPTPFNSRSPAATSLFRTAWSVQPTLTSGSIPFYHAFNAFGGTDRWVAQPGAEVYLVNGEQLSGRSASGTPVVSAHLIWEEL